MTEQKSSQKPWGLINGAALVAVIVVVAMASKMFGGKKITSPEMSLYWGNTCTYCHTLMNGKVYKDFTKKYQVTLKETFLNPTRNAELTQIATEICGFAPTEVGVPLLYVADFERCFVGPPAIEEYMTSLMNGEDPNTAWRADGDGQLEASGSSESGVLENGNE